MFVNLFGPPMEQRCGADPVGPTLEVSAVGELRIFEFLDGGKVAIDQDTVGQWPQVLGGLQFRRVRW
jgi:hypothetical protein